MARRRFFIGVLLVLPLVLGLSAGVVAGPTQAAAKRFRHVDIHVDQYHAYGGTMRPEAAVCLGRVIDDEGGVDQRSCTSWHVQAFKPTVRVFTVTFRWYAGKKLFRKRTKRVTDHRGPVTDRLPPKGLRVVGGDFSKDWRYRGKKVSVKVTVKKKGYRTLVVRIKSRNFVFPDE
ncbi:hypothetical protein KG112_02385 [Nocardioides sp. zg-ZUI104]|uniref:hypothetical protein n=1 Tax=Nocardioides faecalis TaxID=2803858 RepID=UPI001BD0E7EA|nr:hypothetical protein [Nocardioides faecalis]MBS4751654.1 hypothetical protein [Nocardioides faecalis]